VKVVPLWDRFGHSGNAIVEFDKDWTGFKNAIAFEKHFEADNCGKMDFKMQISREKLYGWIAREDDYNTGNIVGTHLRKNGDLKTVSEKQEEEKRKDLKLVSKLKDTLEDKNLHVEEIRSKYEETLSAIDKVVGERERIESHHNEGIFFLFIIYFSVLISFFFSITFPTVLYCKLQLIYYFVFFTY
jgi:hypothetical protein